MVDQRADGEGVADVQFGFRDSQPSHSPSEAALKWLDEHLKRNGLSLRVAENLFWEKSRDGRCYDNVAQFVKLHPTRFEGVFGYMVTCSDPTKGFGFDFKLSGHAVVRDNEGKLFSLDRSNNIDNSCGLFVEDPVITFDNFMQTQTPGERLREMLSKHVSNPALVSSVALMPFGRDLAAERDVIALMRHPSFTMADVYSETGLRRAWKIAESGDLGDGEIATVGFVVFHDELVQGVTVGIPRLLAAAALRKHAQGCV